MNTTHVIKYSSAAKEFSMPAATDLNFLENTRITPETLQETLYTCSTIYQNETASAERVNSVFNNLITVVRCSGLIGTCGIWFYKLIPDPFWAKFYQIVFGMIIIVSVLPVLLFYFVFTSTLLHSHWRAKAKVVKFLQDENMDKYLHNGIRLTFLPSWKLFLRTLVDYPVEIRIHTFELPIAPPTLFKKVKPQLCDIDIVVYEEPVLYYESETNYLLNAKYNQINV
jgi:hypothetical protein